MVVAAVDVLQRFPGGTRTVAAACLQVKRENKYLVGDSLSYVDLSVYVNLSVFQSGFIRGRASPNFLTREDSKHAASLGLQLHTPSLHFSLKLSSAT